MRVAVEYSPRAPLAVGGHPADRREDRLPGGGAERATEILPARVAERRFNLRPHPGGMGAAEGGQAWPSGLRAQLGPRSAPQRGAVRRSDDADGTSSTSG